MLIDATKVQEARKLAQERHEGQKRRGGEPYFNHVDRVASSLSNLLEQVVAYCHDLVEDTDTTLDEIESLFGKRVREAVDHLTHKDGQNYTEYISQVLCDYIATCVKVADIKDNLRDADTLGKHHADKYRLAKKMLEISRNEINYCWNEL
tara:strand:- start:153 stop:602 length:450 start_codon:yes stop_codon:yes gene_type:complete